MFDRRLEPPRRSFFLFGPRSTGKSTWLQTHFADALRLDLLRSETYFQLSSAPHELRSIVAAQPRTRWIVLDEVQRVPQLLDEVHAMMHDLGHRFAITGSSARKLRRGRANLLAGRAGMRQFFPLVQAEHRGAASLDALLRYGSLPAVVADHDSRIDVLEAYAGTYLREEVREEALTRNVQAFSRFLAVAALANAQVTNLSGIARDAGVPRATVTTYFEILTDTLLGRFVPAWTPRARVKEVQHPKFYFFDTGVVRAIQGRLRDRPTPQERGHLLETYLCHELFANAHYLGVGGEWMYWRTPQGREVDFIWRRGAATIAIECKASDRWTSEHETGLLALEDGGVHASAAFGVYLGTRRLRRPWGLVMPVADFLEELAAGRVLPRSEA